MITEDRYTLITGDDSSIGIDDAIAEAVELLEDYLGRPLAAAERTEAMRPDRRGRLWPKATPIIDADDYTIDGLALVSGSPFGGLVGAPFEQLSTIDVTYTGGWQDANAETVAGAADLPAGLARDIAWAAYRILHPNASQTIDAGHEGAQSLRLGDAAVSFGAGGAGATGLDSSSWWSPRTRGYRYQRVDGEVA